MPEDPTAPLYVGYDEFGNPVAIDLFWPMHVLKKSEPRPPVQHDPVNDPEYERAKIARLV